MTYPCLTGDQLDAVLERTSPHSLEFNVGRMHDIFRLPINSEPTLDPELLGDHPITRLEKFKKSLLIELNKIDEIMERLKAREYLITAVSEDNSLADVLQDSTEDCLTDVANWLADLTVDIRSESAKFGIPLTEVTQAVIGSNFSRVGPLPTYDANGKVVKDPASFVAPEAAVKTVLFGLASPPRTNTD